MGHCLLVLVMHSVSFCLTSGNVRHICFFALPLKAMAVSVLDVNGLYVSCMILGTATPCELTIPCFYAGVIRQVINAF